MSNSGEDLRVGLRIRCTVAELVPYGAWCEVPAVEFRGLILIPNIGWGEYRHPRDRLAVGEEHRVEILRYFQEKEVLSLGLKPVLPNLWIAAGIADLVGHRVEGTVCRISGRSATVELSSGALGYLPLDQDAELELGQLIQVTVMKVDVSRQAMLVSRELV